MQREPAMKIGRSCPWFIGKSDQRRSGIDSNIYRGESGIGNWTVIVKDTEVNDEQGHFIDWRLNLWGECIDNATQTLHPYPDEHDDDHETIAGSVATTSVEIGSQATDIPANPTDHVDRPVNAKPSPTPADTETEPNPTFTSAPTSSPTPNQTPSDSFLPSYFPTFGVSKRTQIWIYGALILIVLFCVGLGAYFFMQRRKRLRNSPRDDYEFEVLDSQEDVGGANGQTSGKLAKRRAGELYDAFAGESDEELFSSDGEDEIYRDVPAAERGGGERRTGSVESVRDVGA
jgi:kexin